MTEEIKIRQNMEPQVPDPLRGAKTLREFAGITFSGGTIFPGDPACSLLDPALVNSMAKSSMGVRYDVRGTIIDRVPMPSESQA